jgi:AcrR family transcriptional regulator
MSSEETPLQAQAPAAALDARVVDAAISVLTESGWDGLTQERVAEKAGISRVTTWRQGITRERLVGALLDRLGNDFRDALWPVLTAPGNGAARLMLGLERLCDVIDQNVPLLNATNKAFHWGFREEHGATLIAFIEPYARFLTEGAADGSLRPIDGDVDEAAEVVFNTMCWTYLHLRSEHEVAPERARQVVINLIMYGLANESSPGQPERDG